MDPAAPSLPEEPTALNAPSARRPYLTVLALLAIGFMLFQLAILRELRYQLTTSITLTPFLFSSVIFFIATGSLFAARIKTQSRKVLRLGVLSLPILLLPAFALMLLASHGQLNPSSGRFVSSFSPPPPISSEEYMRSTIFAFVAVGIGGYGIIFFLQGLLFALYFREARADGVLSGVYGADLLASGAGALLGGGLAFWLTPIQTVLLAEVVFVAALVVASRLFDIRRRHVGLISSAAVVLVILELAAGPLDWLENPGFFSLLTHSQWSRYRRIDAEEQPMNLVIYADGMPFQVHDRQDPEHKMDPRGLTVEVIQKSKRPIKDVLIIGAGSGADVRILRDMVKEPLNITAVELDGGFVDTARKSPWLWETFSTAEIVVQEGRYYLENTPRQFDFVIFAFIDPQSASGNIGLPDANFLYTDAGFRSALARVREGGSLYVSRIFIESEQKEWMSRMCAALEKGGASKENVRLYRDRGSSPWGFVGRLSAMHILVGKGHQPPPLEHTRLRALPWIEGARAPTDLSPLSFGSGTWLEALAKSIVRDAVLLVLGSVLLLGTLGTAATGKGRATLFMLGLGSFLLESLVLFNSFLLFGDPNLSAAVAVGVFLLWSGVGSLFSHRLEERKEFRWALPLAILAYAVTAPLINAWLLTAPVPVRLLAFTLHASLGGIPAGMAFPAALRSFPKDSVPVLFFIDVMGCALAPPLFWLAMSVWGLWMVIVLVTITYALVSLVMGVQRARLGSAG